MNQLNSIAACALCLTVLSTAAPAQSDVQRPAYQPLRFNEDWSVLAKMPEEQRDDFWDPIKFIPLTEDGSIWLSFGGSARVRMEHWNNFNFGAPPGVRHDDTFFLARMFLHADLHVGENLRFFIEGKTAHVFDRNLVGGRRTIDVDEFDLHNAFADLHLPFGEDATLTLRGGRHELLFGRQRLVSPLDWANTRRIFEGFSGILSMHGWTVHGFWTRPVTVRKYEFNKRNSGSEFFGVHATGKLADTGASLDAYWFGLRNDMPVTFNATTGSERRHTLGGRLHGRVPDTGFDYDLEGAYQFGDLGMGDISAYMFAAQIGHRFDDVWSKPRVFVGFDYASGDRSPGGDVQTFNQLFPLGHAYFGWIDAIGRQNVMAASGGVTFTPVERLTVDVHGHYFWRASRNDALYNVAGGVLRPAGLGLSRDVGGEVDVLLRYRFDAHTTILLGYSHFFPAAFLQQSGPSKSMGFFYAGAEYTF